jgi:LemA protein
MGTGLIVGLVVLGVGAIVLLWVIATYNRLVASREQVRAGWAQIDVVLKRRYDLIPNLVETVKATRATRKRRWSA